MLWYQPIIKTAAMNTISQQEAFDKGMFGPVYHGTTEESMGKILDTGFQIFDGEANQGNTAHGYTARNYHDGVPPPIHHLGYGIYFSTVKNIAKRFNGNSTKGMKTFYLNVPRLETINFGAPRTMMQWWIKNGYNPEIAKKDRVAATHALTQTLAARLDGVYYKGKGLYKLLDGDQICVFNTASIFMVDKALTKPGEFGSKVKRNDGMIGVISGGGMNQQKINEIRQAWEALHPGEPHPWIKPETTKILTITWQRGGTDMNVQDSEITPL